MTILSLFFLNCFYFPFYFFFTPNLSSLSSSSPCGLAAQAATSSRQPTPVCSCKLPPAAQFPPRPPRARTNQPCLQLRAPAGHLEVQRRELPPTLGRLKLPLRLPVVPALTICCDPSRGQACLTDGGAARSFFFRLRLTRESRERLHLRLRTRSCCRFHRLAGLRVEPVLELLLEPCQTGPKSSYYIVECGVVCNVVSP